MCHNALHVQWLQSVCTLIHSVSKLFWEMVTGEEQDMPTICSVVPLPSVWLALLGGSPTQFCR